ncbi:putative molluscan insulin-related peptide(s) receptor isoform X2 [Physella acuta]|uniref:putative molluscan insulin-related peptide(s) receptor isoform X2 n=1 Tax=Physella acuta TaxID=109671 RepID=UPI0027DC6999|nr:putative molluscan insulin-related peptide(s) receptor isoform X2 [Physella acuta]
MKNRHIILIFLFYLELLTQNWGVTGQFCIDEAAIQENPKDGVCGSIDIRTSISNFRKLENCTVIEGYLHINLINGVATPNDYKGFSFPALREITEYLLLYRAYGLTTLRHLFPNLAVIKGHKLFNNYALISYEMPDLVELGLINLRTISRGGVRLSKNGKLCYIDTVDWSKITDPSSILDIKANAPPMQCPNYCGPDCKSTKYNGVEAKRCWTNDSCQKGISCHCKGNQTCMDDGTCCHEYCLGGCTGPNVEDCYSCRDVIYQGKCQPTCPPNTYLFYHRRCLTDKECLELKIGAKPRLLVGENGKSNLCVIECPDKYTADKNSSSRFCVKCDGPCPKECLGKDISSIQDAQMLHGCSKIIGTLSIQIMNSNQIAKELEKNLGSIREITQNLIIKRSYALTSLYFFKNLEVIGSDSWISKTVLLVQDNYNLQELFPEEQAKKMRLKANCTGCPLTYFQNNRKLCPKEIMEFVGFLGLNFTEKDVSSNNGDARPCVEHIFNVTTANIQHNSVVLQWLKDTGDTRQLLTYIVSFKEVTPEELEDTINIHQGRDACSDDVWLTREVLPSEGPDTIQLAFIRLLKPFTTYAVYVQSYTLASAARTSMSNVLIFSTLPYYPSVPRELVVTSNDPHELHVTWKPPLTPNGNVTFYKVFYSKQPLDPQPYEIRDYCEYPIVVTNTPENLEYKKVEKSINYSSECCACPKSKDQIESETRKREIEIYFENYLHTHIYCKSNSFNSLSSDLHIELDQISLEAYSTMDLNAKNTSPDLTSELPLARSENETITIKNETVFNDYNDSNLTENMQEVEVHNGLEIDLVNLEHFREYTVEVQACQKSSQPNVMLCSDKAITLKRTTANWTEDQIDESTIKVVVATNSSKDVLIQWDPPPRPNGVIIKYHIYYKKANQENLVPLQMCITITEYKIYKGYKLTGLDAGNWTFRINAVSLAGNNTFTKDKFFLVPSSEDQPLGIWPQVVVSLVLFLVIIVVVAIAWILYKRRVSKSEMTVISPNANYMPSEQMYIEDDWEVERDKIKLIKELGQGSFGMVYEGVATGIKKDCPEEEVRVAVKTVNDRASFNDKREFLKEATIMKAFDCHHVVKLLGVVSTGQPALVIMELMALGDLKNFLRKHRPDEDNADVIPPNLGEILQMAGEIADGMAYLADNKFVHRDLAARNCMVAEDKTVKIGDFGMTRDIYETDYYRKGGKGMLPVRWMAPESLKDGIFDIKSDVWSYGVVIWEMVTLAAQPYQGLSNEEVVKYISEYNTMDMPNGCPETMAKLMQLCWRKTPKQRPTFKEIIKYLFPYLKPSFEKVSYYSKDNAAVAETGIFSQPDEDSNDSSSINSLTCEGAAAPRLGSATRNMNSCSPHPSTASVSQYDDDIDSPGYMDEDFDDEESGRINYFPQGMEDIDDSRQPFMADNFIPPVKCRQPLLSHQVGSDNMHNPGLMELQPLITKDKSLHPVSPRLSSLPLTSSASSEYLPYQPPTLPTHSVTDSHHNSLTNADPLNSGLQCDSSNSPSWATPQPLFSARQSPASTISRPTLRLPYLIQPPIVGHHRAPPYNSMDNNNHSTRNNQPNSNDQPAALPANLDLVHIEEGLSRMEETSLTLPETYSPPPNAIASSSSDGSKESTKSSGSHSLINGLTNGHISLPAIRHRTAPC